MGQKRLWGFREMGPWSRLMCCALGQETLITLTVSLHPRCKWVTANLMLGWPEMDWHPIQGSRNTLGCLALPQLGYFPALRLLNLYEDFILHAEINGN